MIAKVTPADIEAAEQALSWGRLDAMDIPPGEPSPITTGSGWSEEQRDWLAAFHAAARVAGQEAASASESEPPSEEKTTVAENRQESRQGGPELWRRLAEQAKAGTFVPDDWNWFIADNPIWDEDEERYIKRTCIYIMGQGAEQLYQDFVLTGEPGPVNDAKAEALIRGSFGIEHIIRGM